MLLSNGAALNFAPLPPSGQSRSAPAGVGVLRCGVSRAGTRVPRSPLGRAAGCMRVAQWRGQGHRVWTAQPLAGVGLEIGRGQGMDARSWISAYAERLGTDSPTRDEFEAILELAAEAAHSSERVAAPVACWVAAKTGVPLNDALEAARRIDEG